LETEVTDYSRFSIDSDRITEVGTNFRNSGFRRDLKPTVLDRFPEYDR